MRREGSQGTLVPAQPLTEFEGRVKLFKVPLLLFNERSTQVMFVSATSAKFPLLSMSAALKNKDATLPLDELVVEPEELELVDPDDELDEDEPLDPLLLEEEDVEPEELLVVEPELDDVDDVDPDELELVVEPDELELEVLVDEVQKLFTHKKPIGQSFTLQQFPVTQVLLQRI